MSRPIHRTATRGIQLEPGVAIQLAEPGRQGLSELIASRQRRPDFVAFGVCLPNPDPILKKQRKDIQVYQQLLADAHIGGCVRRRKAGVLKMEWRVVRDQASARAERRARELLTQLDLRRIMREMLDAPLFGYKPLEVMWSSGSGEVLPLDVVGKPPGWFAFDQEAQLRFLSREHLLEGELLPPRKFLCPAQGASYENPYGMPDLSLCFWPQVFKHGGLKFWVSFTEKYGTPWLVGKVPRGTPAAEQDKLLDQLAGMIQDAVAVIPDDASVDTLEPGGKAASAELYERLLMFCRSEIAIALLGQNQTTEASSNKASAEAGLAVLRELRDDDARIVETTINTLLRWVTDLNEGEAAPAPRFELYEQEEVDEHLAARDEKLVRSGVRLSRSYFMRAYGLGEEDIELGPMTQPSQGVQAAFAEGAGAPLPDALDIVAAAEMAQWQPMLEPLTAPLQALIDDAAAKGETAAQLMARLPQALARMNPDHLAAALTRAAFTARVGAAAGVPVDLGD